MIRYLFRSLQAHVRAGLALYVLTLAGITLGVASVLCIQILNVSALGAFRGSVRAVSGAASFSIQGVAGPFPEDLYVDILAQPDVVAAWPLCRVQAAVDDGPELLLEIIGLDLMNPMGRSLAATEGKSWTGAFTTPGWMAVTPALATARGWQVGDRVTVTRGHKQAVLTVGALFDFSQVSPLASPRLAIMDIAQAQSLFDRQGELDQVDVVAGDGVDARQLARRLGDRLGPAVMARTPDDRLDATRDLLGAFRLNLTALSMVSLFVGLFLVYSATQAFLVRRRREFGVLRALGATRAQVVGLILAEVALLGVVGTALGLPVGHVVARANVEVVSKMLTNIYLLEEIRGLVVPASLYALSILIGVGGAMAGALLPALEIARIHPRALLAPYTLQARAEAFAVPLALSGLALLAATGGMHLLAGTSWRKGGFALGVGLLLMLPLVSPFTIRMLCSRVPLAGFGFLYSFRALAARLQTMSFAVAALAVTVAMLVGTTVMIGSFRSTLEDWIGGTVRADLYVAPETLDGAGSGTLRPERVEWLRRRPEVARMDRLRLILLQRGSRRIVVAGVDMGLRDIPPRFSLVKGNVEQAVEVCRRSGAFLVSEPLARREALAVGDRLELAGPLGVVSGEIAGVYHDYGNERGGVFMDRSLLDEQFGPGEDSGVALYLHPGADAEKVGSRLRAELAGEALRVRSHRRIRQEALELFDQTFAILRILQVMCLLIAVCGIALTLLVTGRSQGSELALYRALGSSRAQVFRVVLGKGLGLAGLGLVLGLAGGGLLSLVLVHVINPAYFGWTLTLDWVPLTIAVQAAAILLAAAAASLHPAARAATIAAADLSRDDLA